MIGTVVYAVRLSAFTVAFPLFAKARGYDAGEFGLLAATTWASLLLFGIPVTILGARGWHRHLLALGPLGSAAGVALIVFAPDNALMVTAAGGLAGGLGGTTFWVLGDPLLANVVPPAGRAHVFALKFFALIAAASLGGGLGGWLPAAFGLSAAFGKVGALGATLLVVALLDLVQTVVFWSMPAVGRSTRAAPAAPSSVRSSGKGVAVSVFFLLLVMPEVGMAVGTNSIKPFLPLFLNERYDLSSAATGTVMALTSLAAGLGVLLLPAIAARMGGVAMITLFRLIGVLAIFLWFAGFGMLAVTALICLFSTSTDGTEATYITEAMNRLPAHRRTAFSGLYAMLWSVGSVVAASLSGYLQDQPGRGFGWAFALGAGGYLFSALWVVGVFARLRLHEAVSDDEEPSAARVIAAEELLVSGGRQG